MMGCRMAPSSQVTVSSRVVIFAQNTPVLLALFGSVAYYGLLQRFSCRLSIQDCAFNSVELVRKR